MKRLIADAQRMEHALDSSETANSFHGWGRQCWLRRQGAAHLAKTLENWHPIFKAGTGPPAHEMGHILTMNSPAGRFAGPCGDYNTALK